MPSTRASARASDEVTAANTTGDRRSLHTLESSSSSALSGQATGPPSRDRAAKQLSSSSTPSTSSLHARDNNNNNNHSGSGNSNNGSSSNSVNRSPAATSREPRGNLLSAEAAAKNSSRTSSPMSIRSNPSRRTVEVLSRESSVTGGEDSEEGGGTKIPRTIRIGPLERERKALPEQDQDPEQSDEREQDRGSLSNDSRNKLKPLVPTKRRLRSNKNAQSSDDDTPSDLHGSRSSSRTSSGWTARQQKMQSRIETASAISKLLEECIAGSNSLVSDGKGEDAYALVVATFGEIEDLEGNAEWSDSDDSDKDDDDMDIDEQEGANTLRHSYRASRSHLQELYEEFDHLKRRVLEQKAADLDKEEALIRNGTHPGLLDELNAIEDRRTAKKHMVEARRNYHQTMYENNYLVACKNARNTFESQKIDVRRAMANLVRTRIARIKQEIADVSARSPRRPLLKRDKEHEARYFETNGYDTCGDSCYDSDSSSGSECSDCGVCALRNGVARRHLRGGPGAIGAPMVIGSNGTIDLAFLYPEAKPIIHGGHQPPPPYPQQPPPSSWAQQRPEGHPQQRLIDQAPSLQQLLIDRQNEDRRRRRRVMDRELQYRAMNNSKGLTESSGHVHMPPPESPRPSTAPLSSASSGDHSASRFPPSARKGPGAGWTTVDRRPRFLPGFGPDSLPDKDMAQAHVSGPKPGAPPRLGRPPGFTADARSLPPASPSETAKTAPTTTWRVAPGTQQLYTNPPGYVPLSAQAASSRRSNVGRPPITLPGIPLVPIADYPMDAREYLAAQRWKQSEMQERSFQVLHNNSHSTSGGAPPPPHIHGRPLPPPSGSVGNARGRPTKSSRPMPQWLLDAERQASESRPTGQTSTPVMACSSRPGQHSTGHRAPVRLPSPELARSAASSPSGYSSTTAPNSSRVQLSRQPIPSPKLATAATSATTMATTSTTRQAENLVVTHAPRDTQLSSSSTSAPAAIGTLPSSSESISRAERVLTANEEPSTPSSRSDSFKTTTDSTITNANITTSSKTTANGAPL